MSYHNFVYNDHGFLHFVLKHPGFCYKATKYRIGTLRDIISWSTMNQQ